MSKVREVEKGKKEEKGVANKIKCRERIFMGEKNSYFILERKWKSCVKESTICSQNLVLNAWSLPLLTIFYPERQARRQNEKRHRHNEPGLCPLLMGLQRLIQRRGQETWSGREDVTPSLELSLSLSLLHSFLSIFPCLSVWFTRQNWWSFWSIMSEKTFSSSCLTFI